MDIDNETQQKIQELQGFEQNLQQIMMQKQAFQMELGETENALTELEKATDDVFKMVGNIMIKTDKTKTLEDLKKKKELLDLRLKSIETQETDLTKQAEELKAEVMKKIK
ncbi:prefoldin subunit beta [Candidatus Pacearchaeota archaeon]|jgi:prefoldin beta subunit|nr:prefoldin subunit beta [Candidatus Pacearchaeota archaeon]|tara:strand:- start:320 stop:649 length:330 start_codon:yes stop_codon:yes gene_type:complete